MKSDIGKFKEQIYNLIDYLKEISKNDSTIEKIAIKANLGISANPREVIKLFAEEITPFADQMLTGNDGFFLDKTDFFKAKNEEDSNMFNDIITNLKTLWIKFSIEEREKVIRYFKLLIILSCLVTKSEELRSIINKYRDIKNPLVFDH